MIKSSNILVAHAPKKQFDVNYVTRVYKAVCRLVFLPAIVYDWHCL